MEDAEEVPTAGLGLTALRARLQQDYRNRITGSARATQTMKKVAHNTPGATGVYLYVAGSKVQGKRRML
jgi:hypothetical protein